MPLVDTIIPAISVGLLAASVVYAARQVRLLRKQHSENHDWNRRVAAQQAVREYRTIQDNVEALSKHLDFQNRTEGIPKDLFKEKFKEVPDLQSKMHTVLNFFESLARGIHQGIYDEEVIKTAQRGNMMRVYESFKYYAIMRREELRNEKIFRQLEILVEKWKSEERPAAAPRPQTGK